jgi:SAM-dependent methyltransferase
MLAPLRSPAETPLPYDYDTIDVGYYDRIYRRGSGVQSKWHHLKFDYLRRFVRSGQEHLDIGCGPGTFIGTLDAGVRSTGVDIAAAQIRHATEAYGASHRAFRVVEPGVLPFDEARFDAVTCVELLEHLPLEAGSALCREARRVLKRGATLIATTPDYGGLWPVLEWAVNRLGEVSYAEQHVTRFTRQRLEDVLRGAGYANVQVHRFQFAAPFAAALGWRFADAVARLEPAWLTQRLGFLLLAVATT